MQVQQWSLNWAGRTLSVETGKFALQTNASCTVRYGDTVLLATAVMSNKTRDGIDFFPLMVNFEEKLYAAGKIKGSRFIKREGRPSEEAILSGRLVDRAIRPLFNQDTRNDAQVILTALSYDGNNDPQIPALIAASVALSLSDIPWNGPIAGVRVGRVAGAWKINPSFSERGTGDADIVIAGSPEKIIMVEAASNDVPDQEILEAMQLGAKEMGPVIDFIKKIRSEAGKEKMDLEANLSESEQLLKKTEAQVRALVKSHVDDWMFDGVKKGKAERVTMVDRFQKAVEEMLTAQEIEEKIKKIILGRVKIYVEEFITQRILDKGQRLDGRGLDDIRPLYGEVGLLPRTHGTGLFMRGDTQVLSVVTLGAPGDVQTLDTMEEEGTKRYMHHYNDTPATYGEAGPMRGPGNRAIGHGALAERALEPVLPDELGFPYAIRVVSEVLGSNGSSSMASACASTLALMDAGVPIKKPIAGIAMGLASDEKGRYKVLTDLQDIEDGPGGMDFKITGTHDGVTAIQMDTKTHGLSWEIVKQTFKQSFEARLKILDFMKTILAEPRKDLSPFAPRIVTIQINPDKIRDVIGPGGKIINKIIAETGVAIDIEDDGRVNVTSNDAVGMEKAVTWIKQLTHEVTAGEQYEGTVVRMEDFGAFIEILPGQDGLVHVSEIAWARTNKPSDVLKMGDKVKVLVKEIDNLGRINLSMKALLPKPEGYQERPPMDRMDRARSPRPMGGNRGGGRPRY
ncbi:MAG: polyribonucleotide nucleotidyltransferase [Candidatus Magasanikbacteria bacterium RIFCSPLOWO2_02_FULL_44_11]|uniref:Polyribonucleotide nucleotidyltransferase n=1 Tax=Candidatus Magasanikbacteria bacterium RIFCSPLOWO2_02_FULL_44_11 TaxID=1798689 RepID=A0A1F6N918_9BACT|nr:MAG: polyribonucleotide nucleotidyltransferase [Candidatus Magasanikbacteria bacterium RIFCSPLOWO2_02_FULL_44_11]